MTKPLVTLAALIMLAGCAGASPVADPTPRAARVTTPTAASADPTPEPEDAVTSAPPSECLDATELGQAVLIGALDGTGATFVRSAAVKSPDFAEVYFVAVEFSATGVPNQVGVWASNSLARGGGVIFAVDGTAQEFTDWGHADETAAAISPADPSVELAKACLR